MPSSGKLIYRPALYAEASLHYVRASGDCDVWVDVKRLARCDQGVSSDPWETSVSVDEWFECSENPRENFEFSDLPTPLRSASNFKIYEKLFKEYLYRHVPLTLYKSVLLKEFAPAGSDEAEARRYFETIAREARDLAQEKLRSQYAGKMKTLDVKLRNAEAKHAEEKSQASQAWLAPAVSIAGSLLNAFVGRKGSRGPSVTRVESAVRGASRATKQHQDVRRAEEQVVELAKEVRELDERLREELDELSKQYDVRQLELETVTVPARKSDLKSTDPTIVWLPWHVDEQGIATLLR
jgi:hypothetical protein